MKANPYRSHPVAAALAAALISAALMASVVESFEPAQLLRFYDRDANGNVVALERRADDRRAEHA